MADGEEGEMLYFVHFEEMWLVDDAMHPVVGRDDMAVRPPIACIFDA